MDSLRKSVLSFHHEVSRDLSHVIKLGGKRFYPLSHLSISFGAILNSESFAKITVCWISAWLTCKRKKLLIYVHTQH